VPWACLDPGCMVFPACRAPAGGEFVLLPNLERWVRLKRGLFEDGQMESKIGKIEMHLFLVDIPACCC
jgi:hypothetical protein